MKSLGVLAACVALVMGAVTLTSSVASASTTGSISGTVSYGSSGVEGVCVSATPSGGGSSVTSTTAGDGTYTIDGLNAGAYDVDVDPTCFETVSSIYASQTLSSVGVAADTATTADATLTLGATISGTVSYEGTPVEGVCVNAYANSGRGIESATTSAGDGSYTIDGLAAGTYDLDINPTCNESVSSLYANQTFSSITVSAGTTTTENALLALGGTISGTVSYGGSGVAGVCVEAYLSVGGGIVSVTTTAGDGTYTLSGLAAGSYDFVVDPTCYGTESSIYVSQSLSGISVSASATTTQDASLTLGGTIAGTISFGGSGVAGVCVSAVPSGGVSSVTTTTASDGTYTIGGLAAGTYDVDIDPTCKETAPSTYASQTLSSVSVSASATTTEDASLALGGSMMGVVTFDGVGVGGVCVNEYSNGVGGYPESVITASDGSYSFSGLPADADDAVQFDPTCGGSVATQYESQTVSPVAITASATTTEDYSLVLVASISGTVSYLGSGIAGVCVTASPSGGGSNVATTTANDGSYAFSGLATGSYNIDVDPTCSESVTSTYEIQDLTSVAVTAGATTTADVSLALGGSIGGNVAYDGVGVGGVCVNVYSNDDGGYGESVITASDGSYSLSGLPADAEGVVDIDPSCGDSVSTPYAVQILSPVAIVVSATTTENATLALAVSITGVVSYEGTGVAGVCVDATLSGGGSSDTTTASDGSYTLSGLVAGSYSVDVDPTCSGSVSSTYASQTLDPVVVSTGATTTENASLTLAKVAQSSLTLTSVSGTVGTDLSLSASGGSGTGALSYVLDSAGTAGCTLNSATLSASVAGTCTVTATRAGDATYQSVSSSATTVTFASPSGGGGGGGGGGAAMSNAPPPSILGASSYGSPTSGQTSSSGPTTLTATLGGVTTSITVPTGALPNGTTLSVYPITDSSSLSADIPSNQSYVAAFAVSWLTTNGTSPSATSPISMTITDSSIAQGDSVYVLTPSGLVVVGTATTNGTITFTFTSDPVFLVTTGAEAQSALSVTTTKGVVGKPLRLAISGGSGTGAITFSVTNGTARGCAVVGGVLTAKSAGTCRVTVTKSGDSTYGSASSAVVSVALALPRRPAKVTTTFAKVSSRLTARDRRVIAALSKKLLAGATVIVTGYAKGDARLARARARAVSNNLKTHVKVHVVLKYSTVRNGATVVTRSQ